MWYRLSDSANWLGFNGAAAHLQLKALKGDTGATGDRARKEPNNPAHRKRLDQLALDTGYQFERLRNFKSVDLIERAARLYIEGPALPPEGEESEFWAVGEFFRARVLTDKGMEHVRSRVYAREREEREALIAWAPAVTGLVTALAGLIGVAIGFVSLMKR